MLKGFHIMKLFSYEERYNLRELIRDYPNLKQFKNEVTGDEYELIDAHGYWIRLYNKTKKGKESIYKLSMPDNKIYTVIHADVIKAFFGANTTSAVDVHKQRLKKKQEEKLRKEREKNNAPIINQLKKPKK